MTAPTGVDMRRSCITLLPGRSPSTENPRIVYAGSRPWVYRSEDGGDTWRKMADRDCDRSSWRSVPVMRLAVDPNSPETSMRR